MQVLGVFWSPSGNFLPVVLSSHFSSCYLWMLYLKVKYRSNEVNLRVEYSSLTQTLLGLEAVLCSGECCVGLFETLEPPVHISPFGGLWVGAQVLPSSC